MGFFAKNFMIRKALSERQLQVMETLWNAEKGLTASEIVNSHDDLQINTVQASLRSLAKKQYIKVGDIVYSGTVLARKYVPIITKQEYLETRCEALSRISDHSLPMLMVGLIKDQKDDKLLQEMQEMIVRRRKELEKEK